MPIYADVRTLRESSYYCNFIASRARIPCTITLTDKFLQRCCTLQQCFSTFVRPRPGKFFFHKKRARSQQIYSSVPFRFFLSLCIKLIQVLIINYGIIIKSISTLMYTVWHVDKYKITFKLVINSRKISRGPAYLMPRPGTGAQPGG